MDTGDKEEKGLAELAGCVEAEKDDVAMPKDETAEKARWLFRRSEPVTIH